MILLLYITPGLTFSLSFSSISKVHIFRLILFNFVHWTRTLTCKQKRRETAYVYVVSLESITSRKHIAPWFESPWLLRVGYLAGR